ncbi:DUF2254 domain-containing protein [Pseudomonas matsuisoli]|uniref:DUF2254 domain-containing protein n=1 Tax=Pseudomonas matsuisoli TaxID=1515666 RepID=A0A917PHY9_9PSED|nr:DUF2254 domain-containing protein [Pseudomonas matsuisoli]GGJ78688.1 hypothetical protein GCM10009304_00760 [Pseudomonas matsuisoli]
MFRLKVWLARLRKQLWFRPTLWSLLATAAALLGTLANSYLPESSVPSIERDTLQNLLTIIASSMLTVTTFSLSILVGAFSSASSSATPRATRLMVEDDSAQSAIASFIAAFIYSIISLLALGIGYYGPSGRFVLLIGTVLVTAWVIVALLRWLQTLASLGRMGDTITRVERVAARSLESHRRQPYLNAECGPREVHGWPVHASSSGYLAFIDVNSLQSLAQRLDLKCHVRVRPGGWIDPSVPIAILDRECSDTTERDRILDAFHIATERSFEQDPRFGLLVLSEIGQRGLSSAVNDSGTPIAVLSSLTRVFIDAARIERSPAECTRVTVVPLDEQDLMEDAFGALERDGAASLELNVRLQKMLHAIARNGSEPTSKAAQGLAQRACRRATARLPSEDSERLTQVYVDTWGTE